MAQVRCEDGGVARVGAARQGQHAAPRCLPSAALCAGPWPSSAPRPRRPRPLPALNLEPAQPGSELSGRINAVLGRLRSARELWQEVWPVLQGTPMEAHLMPFLVEDRLASAGSMGYLDFMMQLQKQLLAKA